MVASAILNSTVVVNSGTVECERRRGKRKIKRNKGERRERRGGPRFVAEPRCVVVGMVNGEERRSSGAVQ